MWSFPYVIFGSYPAFIDLEGTPTEFCTFSSDDTSFPFRNHIHACFILCCRRFRHPLLLTRVKYNYHIKIWKVMKFLETCITSLCVDSLLSWHFRQFAHLLLWMLIWVWWDRYICQTMMQFVKFIKVSSVILPRKSWSLSFATFYFYAPFVTGKWHFVTFTFTGILFCCEAFLTLPLKLLN